MATTSNSTTTTVIQSGGALDNTANAQFKDQDYPQGLSDKTALRRFFTQLNPLVARVKDLGDGGVSLANLDADFLSVPVNAYQSEWVNIPVTGIVTGGTGILCADGTSGKLAIRKDAWGMVTVYLGVNTSSGGTMNTNPIPTEYWPTNHTVLPIVCTGTNTFITVTNAGNINMGIGVTMAPSTGVFVSYPCATLAPGTIPGAFPVYLKVAQGRTPVAVLFAGAKPQNSQDVYKTTTGVQGAPLACSWTFLGAQTAAADGTRINQVRIDNVPGLVAGIPYTLNFLVFYGQTGTSSGA